MGVDIGLSDRCNLNCAWCYTTGGHCKGPNLELSKRVVEWHLSQLDDKTQKTHVSIYGGEPLFEWETLKAFGEYLVERRKSWGKPISSTIVTNCSLITQDKLDWLKAHDIGISTSIDGCPEAIDRFRIYRANGKGSSAEVIAGVELAHRNKMGHSARATCGPENLPLFAKSIKYLAEEMRFRTVNMILAGGASWKMSDIPVLREQVREVNTWWLEKLKAAGTSRDVPSLYHIRNVLHCIGGGRGHRICGAGAHKGRVGVDMVENLWPCHRFCNSRTDEMWKIGTLETGATNERLMHAIRHFDITKDIEGAECANCPWAKYCYCICWHEVAQSRRARFVGDRIKITPDPFWCETWRTYYASVQEDIIAPLGADNPLLEPMLHPEKEQKRQQEARRKEIEAKKAAAKAAGGCGATCNCHKPKAAGSPRITPAQIPGGMACDKRGAQIGEREITVRVAAFACPKHSDGVTLKDCVACKKEQATNAA